MDSIPRRSTSPATGGAVTGTSSPSSLQQQQWHSNNQQQAQPLAPPTPSHLPPFAPSFLPQPPMHAAQPPLHPIPLGMPQRTSTLPAPPDTRIPWSRTSTQNSRFGGLASRGRADSQDFDNSTENSVYSSSLTWAQRLNYIAHHRHVESQGFIWDSLDNSMEGVQEARRMRKNGPIRLITNRRDTSYNTIRSTIRLQNTEKRSDIRNIVSSIRLGLDYDLYKSKAKALLNSKARTIFFIMMDLAVDALFCVLYLVEAQDLSSKDPIDYPNPTWLFVPRPRAIWVIAVVMSSWNVMSALIRFIFADSKWRFIFSIQTLLDMVTAVPFLLSGAFLPQGQSLYVPYFLRSWSVISRLQRALSIGVEIGISDQPFDPVKAKLIALVAYFIAILYNGMAAFLYTETMFAPKNQNPSIFDAFYFILITASTVGYGDITPKSLESKLVVMIFIIVALSVVPGLIAGTIETVKSSRSGGGSYIQSRGANGTAKQYLVMIGDFQSAKRISDLLSGFFNKEFSDSDVRVVFLSRNKPSKDVKTLLDMPTHQNRTTMLVGNGLDEVDLKRCQARDAGAVFVIPDRVISDLESQDTMTTLLAWSLHLYAPNTRVFTYNLLPETETFQWGIVEQSMCISDVKQLLLAYNCRHRGTATLILNLLHPSEPANSYDEGWQAQYGDGTGNELYTSSVPEVFIGWTFAQVSWFVFQEFQSILVGVDIFLRPEGSAFTGCMPSGRDGFRFHEPGHQNPHRAKSRASSSPRRNSTSSSGAGIGISIGLQQPESDEERSNGQYHLTLNPGNSYRLGRYDQLIFIAQSPQDIDAINSFTMNQYERLLRDEKGHLDGSRTDFAKAMDMYYMLRESRAEARAAAKRRAEHRKGRRAKYADGSMKRAMEKVCNPEGLTSEKCSGPATNLAAQGASGSSNATGSITKGGNPKKRAHKKARPTWNVALYDDDDDDDFLSDSSSLRRIKSAQRGSSSQSYRIGRSRQSKKSSGKSQQEGFYDEARDKDFLMGTQDRQELRSKVSQQQERQNQQRERQPESFPLSEPRFWSRPDGPSDHGPLVVPFLNAHSALHTEFYPSNFDRNAAAAAADDAKQSGEESDPKPSLAQDPLIPTTIVTDPSGSLKELPPSPALQAPQPPWAHRSQAARNGRTSVQGSFQPLDETTYIGQTAETRSETKDLPLCHLLISPPDSIKPSIRDDLSLLRNHIVVCANVGENLYRFLSTLRLAQIPREDVKTIVVLTMNPHETRVSDSSVLEEMEERDDDGGNAGIGEGGRVRGEGAQERYSSGTWDAILSFPRVYWVAGNCRHQRDLVRAGILGASSIVVMSHRVNGLDRDEFADSTAIMAHHMIYQTLQQRNRLGRQHVVVEISERSNIRFLNMRDVSMIRNYQGVISKVSRINSQSRSSTGGFWMTPIFASGQVLLSSLLVNVLFQAYSKTHILDVVKLCCGVRFKQAIELDQTLGIDSSNICLIETPAQLVGKSFLDLFQTMALQYGIVPLGLYRAPDRELNNALPFVFTNPLPGILLKNTDMIYVLKS